MHHALALYEPPSAKRAALASGTAPLVVLLAFTLLVSRVIDPQVCFAWFTGATLWLIYELTDYQRGIDAYNAAYVRQHLAWRSTDSLRALVDHEAVPADTREFVYRFLAANRMLFSQGPSS